MPDSTATVAPRLFQPLALRSLSLRNRIVVSPMCQYTAHEGMLNDWHLVHLGKFALGGAALVFTEATAVQKRGRITHGCTGLWHDEQIAGHAAVAHFLRLHGAVPGIQLAHAGRKASTQRPWLGGAPLGAEDVARGDLPWEVVGPSAVAVGEGWPLPHALSVTEIQQVVEDFAAATRRSLAAGYQAVELHGAHGYLIQSFLSPIGNKRNDAYGGDLKGRMRMALEVTEAVRGAWPDELPLFFRVSAIDRVDGGWTLDDTVVLARALKAQGVDVVDCSSGGISGLVTAARVKRQAGDQVPFAERVRQEAGTMTMAVGLITDPHQAEEILVRNQADLVALGRELLADPNWPLHAATALGAGAEQAPWPQQYAWGLTARSRNAELYRR